MAAPRMDLPPWASSGDGTINPFVQDHAVRSLTRYGDELQEWGEGIEDDIATLVANNRRYGFEVWRSTNAAVVTAGSTVLITFDTVITESGWDVTVPTSSFTVPSDGGGIYACQWNTFYGGSIPAGGTGLYPFVRVAGSGVVRNQIITPLSQNNAVGSFRLVAGNAVSAGIFNDTSGSVTPTSYGGDSTSPRFLFFTLWRVSI